MTRRNLDRVSDRITLRHATPQGRAAKPVDRRRQLWTLMGGIVGSLLLLWIMVQLGPASSDAQTTSPTNTSATPQTDIGTPPDGASDDKACVAAVGPAVSVEQGPAIDTPQEIIAMLDQRKKDLNRRELDLRQEQARLVTLKAEVESILARSEAMQKHLEEAQQKAQKQAAAQKAQQEQALADRKTAAAKQVQEQKAQSQAQLAKMYESMPAEDAAARLEHMPERKAIEMLRLVKGKTAGAILSQMKAERAAKLTEQLLASAP